MSLREQGRSLSRYVCKPRTGAHRSVVLALCLLLMLPAVSLGQQPATQPPETTLKFGLLPFASPVALFERFAPLRDYLNFHLGTGFALETARDFSVHVQRIEAGDYDLVLTAPHFVPIALDAGHYQLLAAYMEDLATVYLVASDDPATRLSDLAGRRIGTPPPEALITLVGEDHLLDILGSNAPVPDFVSFPSHNAAIHAITSGLVDAAAVSINVARLEINAGAPVRILDETPSFPGVGILAHLRLPDELRAGLRETLITMHEREDGSDVLRQMLYPGYKAATPEDYEAFRSILPRVREHLVPAPIGP